MVFYYLLYNQFLGIFHQMWSKVIFKKLKYLMRDNIKVIYYQKYVNGLEKGVTQFQRVFNQQQEDQEEGMEEINWKRDQLDELYQNYYHKHSHNNNILQQQFNNNNKINNNINIKQTNSPHQPSAIQFHHHTSTYTNQIYKSYLQTYDDSTCATGVSHHIKSKCILLYENIKNQINQDFKEENMKKMLENNVKKRIEIVKNKKNEESQRKDGGQMREKKIMKNWKENRASQGETDEDQMNQNNQVGNDGHKDKNNIKNYQQNLQNISPTQPSPISRFNSPNLNQYLLFQQFQTNQRRMVSQMACIFLQIQHIYSIFDIQIIEVKQSLFSQKQQIVIMKAYTTQFSSSHGMMRIQPRLKTLISCYKFMGLIQLIRLQKCYGKFDGFVIYSMNWDFKKFLDKFIGVSYLNDSLIREMRKIKQKENEDDSIKSVEDGYREY